jgi:hypothetical protein
LPNVSAGSYHVDWEGTGNENVTFKVSHAREEEGPWIESATYQSPGVDIALSYLNLNFLDPVAFKVKAYNATSHKLVATSEIVKDAYIPEKGHFLRYREIIRRTYLDITRYVGARSAYLFRLKTYGAVAKNVNPILSMPIGSEDPDAYGQKFDGGYFDPIRIPCGYAGGETSNIQLSVGEQGATDIRKLALITMPSPIIRPYDIIVNPDSNERYVVVAPVKTETFRDLTIRQIPTISLLPPTDKAYSLNLPS